MSSQLKQRELLGVPMFSAGPCNQKRLVHLAVCGSETGLCATERRCKPGTERELLLVQD